MSQAPATLLNRRTTHLIKRIETMTQALFNRIANIVVASAGVIGVALVVLAAGFAK